MSVDQHAIRMEERVAVVSAIAGALRDAIRDGWTLREFGELFVAEFCQPTLAQSTQVISQGLAELGQHTLPSSTS